MIRLFFGVMGGTAGSSRRLGRTERPPRRHAMASAATLATPQPGASPQSILISGHASQRQVARSTKAVSHTRVVRKPLLEPLRMIRVRATTKEASRTCADARALATERFGLGNHKALHVASRSANPRVPTTTRSAHMPPPLLPRLRCSSCLCPASRHRSCAPLNCNCRRARPRWGCRSPSHQLGQQRRCCKCLCPWRLEGAIFVVAIAVAINEVRAIAVATQRV